MVVRLVPALLVGLFAAWGCAHARPSGEPTRVAPPPPPPTSRPEHEHRPGPSSQPATPASRPATEERREELRQLVQHVLAHPDLAGARVSVLAAPASGGEPLVSVAPEAHRLPASNAKLLTTTAAALALPGKYAFVTEVSRGARGQLCLRGTGDPVLSRGDLVRLARAVAAHGVRAVSGIVVDDGHFDRERYAPGFEAFSAGSHYRPTSGAVNVDSNAIVIQVSAPADRKRPRVDVTPPSDYVVVRKLVRYARARRGPEASTARIQVTMQPRGSSLWLTISGTMGRQAAPWTTKRAVYDPALNAAWALRRALSQAGLTVSGGVRRGTRPPGAAVLARKQHSLDDVLRAANTHSDNLAAETLVRALSFISAAGVEGIAVQAHPGPGGSAVQTHPGPRDRRRRTWAAGLKQLRATLDALEIGPFEMYNGSGLHRRSWVTAQTMVTLLEKIHSRPALRRAIVPSLAIAGRSGTLAPRLRHTAAEGFVVAKTGTLGGALALSGFVDPSAAQPLAFSILVNGRSDNRVRDQMDRIAELLARYARGLPLVEERPGASQPAAASRPAPVPRPEPASRPTPVSRPKPASRRSPASQPAPVPVPRPEPASRPTPVPRPAPASQPAEE